MLPPTCGLHPRAVLFGPWPPNIQDPQTRRSCAREIECVRKAFRMRRVSAIIDEMQFRDFREVWGQGGSSGTRGWCDTRSIQSHPIYHMSMVQCGFYASEFSSLLILTIQYRTNPNQTIRERRVNGEMQTCDHSNRDWELR